MKRYKSLKEGNTKQDIKGALIDNEKSFMHQNSSFFTKKEKEFQDKFYGIDNFIINIDVTKNILKITTDYFLTEISKNFISYVEDIINNTDFKSYSLKIKFNKLSNDKYMGQAYEAYWYFKILEYRLIF